VRVQVVADQHDLRSARVPLVTDGPQEVGEIDGRLPLGHRNVPLASQRFKGHEQVGHAAPLVFVVLRRR
jgi:hypothetical protein